MLAEKKFVRRLKTSSQRAFLLVLLALLGSNLSINSSSAIQGGESAKGTGFVVAMVVQLSDSSGTLCTGGLVAPKVVATAAHCVVKRGVVAKPESILIFSPGSELTSPISAKVRSVIVPSDYKNTSDAGEPSDIAFIVFDRVLSSITIDLVADQALVEKVIKTGAEIRLYGYGITGTGQPAAGYPKSMVLKPTQKQELTGFAGKENTFINYAQEQTGAACNGDSGGPAVARFEGSLILISVHSSSSGICSEGSGNPINWGTIPGEFRPLYEQALKEAAEPTVTSTPTASPSPEVSVAPVKKKRTITCVKGTLVKKVTAINPKCPKGYKIKR